MGLLTEYKEQEKPVFNKERIIQEIKDGLEDFPEWSWLTTPEYEFDLILVRSKIVREEIVNNSNPNTEYRRVVVKTYQIARGIFVTQDECEPQQCNMGQLKIESARELFNKIKEYDEN